ncbi:MAG: hypothetical protein HY930_02465 [Euryarchaeota archaeon]|nr:hypothetical protein [Euryarchaeota archaeon]
MRGILILLGLVFAGLGFGVLNYTESQAFGLIKSQPYKDYAFPLFIGGAILILVGVFTGGKTESVDQSGSSASKVKRKVIAKTDATTVKCPVCQFPLDVITQTEGTCPKCKNEIEVFFEG